MENSHSKNRVIENPVNGEKVTFLKTTAETNGEFLQLEIELAPHGKTPAHFHMQFTEKFKVLDGELTLLIGKKDVILKAGEEAIIPPKQVHRFYNTSGKPITFLNEMWPAGNFEKAIRVGDGLAFDGKANKNGLPKNLFHFGLIFEWVGAYLPGIPVSVQNAVFGSLAKMAKRRGIDKKLEEKYL